MKIKKVSIILTLAFVGCGKTDIYKSKMKSESIKQIDNLISTFETTKTFKDFKKRFDKYDKKIELHAPSCRPKEYNHPLKWSHLDIFKKDELFNIPDDLIKFHCSITENEDDKREEYENSEYEYEILQYLRLSNTAKYRFEHLKKIFSGKNSFYWPDRGGFGLSNLLTTKYLFSLKELPLNKEHIYCGYSDITAMLLYLVNQFNLTPIHGPMAFELFAKDKDPKNFQLLADMVLEKKRCSIENLKPCNPLAKIEKKLTGKVIIGNMTLLELSSGTAYSIAKFIKKESKVIIGIEDIGEAAYSFQRTMDKCKAPNEEFMPCIFNPKKVQAIIFGAFSSKDKTLQKQIELYAKTIDIPCYITAEFGHGYTNKPIMLNTEYCINKSNIYTYSLDPA